MSDAQTSDDVQIPCFLGRRKVLIRAKRNHDVVITQDTAAGANIAVFPKRCIASVGTAPERVVVLLNDRTSHVLSRRWSDVDMLQWIQRMATHPAHLCLANSNAITLWGNPASEGNMLCCADLGVIAAQGRTGVALPWDDLECVVLQRTVMTNTFDCTLLHGMGSITVERLPAHMLQALRTSLRSTCTVIDKGADVVDRVPSNRPSCGWQYWFQ